MSEIEETAKVLVVDDQHDNLVLISLAVQEMGFRVITAVNGEDAVAVALLASPQLILMDIAMPVLDGLEATRLIRQRAEIREVPVVILSAFDSEDFRQRAEEAGVNGYFRKPVDFDRLRGLMNTLLRGISGEEKEAQADAVSLDTGRLDPRFMLWRMFCAEMNIPVETLPSELDRAQKGKWERLKKNKRPLFRF